MKNASRFTLHASLFIALFSLCPPAIGQEKLSMAFIYPGGQGSQEDAQPILDRFFEQVQKKGGPAMTGTYYPSLEEGLNVAKSGKVHLGIINLETYLTHKNAMPMEIILATLPLASNSQTERYFFLTTKEVAESLEVGKPHPVYLSRPMSPVFFRSILMANIPETSRADFQLEQAPNLLGQLKKIATGELKASTLLDTYDYYSLRKLNLDWVKNLRLVYSSPLVPSSPVVLFAPVAETEKAKIISVFLSLSDSTEGKEIMQTLRLKGFARPELSSYSSLEATLAKALLAAPTTPPSSPN